jgi:hypothetical protein
VVGERNRQINYAWKHLQSESIVQTHIAKSKDDLFEMTGFGAIRTDEPLKGCLAVEVAWRNNQWKERSKS